ncbi:MAG: hypothetical protein IKQ61_10590 [Spirochaetales bacterium]|nr:hypothetical protein [Spirochaetales bacterium]
MGLQYNILWLDDRIEEYQTLEIDEYLEQYLDELFFSPHLYMYETIEDAKKNLEKKKWDVIFSDFNINESKNGEQFIRDIRNNNINSEVLFYSAQQDLPKMEIDRISFLRLSSDKAYEELKGKMKSVIDLTVEKLNDLTNLRGLVMSEVSELDDKMKNIVADYCKKSVDNEQELRNYIIGKIEEHLKGSLDTSQSKCDKKCIHQWKNKTISEVVFEQNFDSYTTARALDHILKKQSIPDVNKFLDDYYKAIIKNRNELAHCRTKLKEDGSEVLITKNGEKEFTSDDINKIRKNIIGYHKMFEKLKTNL